jgi:hypothetical protein
MKFLITINKNKTMADDPKKKGADAKRISQQPWEQAYQKRKREGKTSSSSSKSSGSSSRKKD